MITVRNAGVSDIPRLLAIYAPYVRDTAVTFEYTVPDAAEFERRMRRVKARFPYLVIEKDGRVMGYAYAGPLKERAAYDRAVETTIYLDMNARGEGLGRRLYEALEEALKKMGILNLYACIALPPREDEYLTNASRDFHAHMGYRVIGTFSLCGYKFGRWYHMIWMEKMIGEHGGTPAPVRAYADAENEACSRKSAGSPE